MFKLWSTVTDVCEVNVLLTVAVCATVIPVNCDSSPTNEPVKNEPDIEPLILREPVKVP